MRGLRRSYEGATGGLRAGYVPPMRECCRSLLCRANTPPMTAICEANSRVGATTTAPTARVGHCPSPPPDSPSPPAVAPPPREIFY